MEQVKLDRLLISEVSGVDDPANQLPGWMVTKGVEVVEQTGSESIVAKIKGILLGASIEKEGIDMEKDELVAVLEESNKSLVAAVAEAVSKSLTPAEGEGATETAPAAVVAPAAEAVTAITAEDVAKAVTDAVEAVEKTYNEILEKVLDRLEGVETHLGIAARKSLEGQETPEGEATTKVAPKTPDLGDAIAGAFARRS